MTWSLCIVQKFKQAPFCSTDLREEMGACTKFCSVLGPRAEPHLEGTHAWIRHLTDCSRRAALVTRFGGELSGIANWLSLQKLCTQQWGPEHVLRNGAHGAECFPALMPIVVLTKIQVDMRSHSAFWWPAVGNNASEAAPRGRSCAVLQNRKVCFVANIWEHMCDIRGRCRSQ